MDNCRLLPSGCKIRFKPPYMAPAPFNSNKVAAKIVIRFFMLFILVVFFILYSKMGYPFFSFPQQVCLLFCGIYSVSDVPDARPPAVQRLGFWASYASRAIHD